MPVLFNPAKAIRIESKEDATENVQPPPRAVIANMRSLITLALVFLTSLHAFAGNPPHEKYNIRARGRSASGASELPGLQDRTHRVGNIRLGICNCGVLGAGGGDACSRDIGRGLEFPAGSGTEYLFAAGLWIGAVKSGDTLVSTAFSGGNRGYELYPKPRPNSTIIERTRLRVLEAPPNSFCSDVHFSENAVSDQDFIAEYYDTVTADFVRQDPVDGRRHVPLDLKIMQRSYSWSFTAPQGYFLVDYLIENIGSHTLNDVYIGLYVDFDVYNFQGAERSDITDDISGFLYTITSESRPGTLDTVNVAWTADADGDPEGNSFGSKSPTGVAGIRVLRAPRLNQGFSFNWWGGHNNPALDWGPNLAQSKVEFVLGNLGKPEGDRARYQMMSNGEIDYDQIESALDHQVTGWLPPPNSTGLATDIADGYDTYFLLGFGPTQLKPDSTVSFTIAVLAAQDFHTNPQNYNQFFNSSRPQDYRQGLNFESLARVAQYAGWSYDVPGLDSDGDGYRGKFQIIAGDTIFYEGDGVPDFQAPQPPFSPELRFENLPGRVVMHWNGQAAETEEDPLSRSVDFEGYRVYMSRSGQLNDFVRLTQRDMINYSRRKLNPNSLSWEAKDPPLTLDSLKTMYDTLSQRLHGYPFHPDSFSVALKDRALLQIVLDERDPSKLDSNYYFFESFDINAMVDDGALASAVSQGLDVAGVIRKLYPNTNPSDTEYRDDGSPFAPFYEYEYVLKDISLAEPVYMAVTTFDFGGPAIGLPSRESSPLANAKEVWPINSAFGVNSSHPEVGVYPNPYRIIDGYNTEGWENRRGLEPDQERARQVTFYNVPDTCVLSIWSLDGDLVRELKHAADPSASDATVVVWNLITRNTQAVKTGIYIYSVESRFGTDVGKLVIIK